MSIQATHSVRGQAALASCFKALADPARVGIVTMLARAEQEICVCDLTTVLGLNQSTVSHHLKILKDAELVRSERRGTWGYYSLAPGAREYLEQCLATIFALEELV